MRRLGAERPRLTVVADQIGGPTAAADIARAVLTMATAMADDPAKGGIYHFAGAPDVSWADFTREIFAQSGLSPEVALVIQPTVCSLLANIAVEQGECLCHGVLIRNARKFWDTYALWLRTT